MSKLGKKIASLVLCFSTLNLSSNVFAREKAECSSAFNLSSNVFAKEKTECSSAFNLSSNIFANEKAECFLRSLVSNKIQGFRNQDNFLTDFNGTVLRLGGEPIQVPKSFRNYFPLYNNENIVKFLSVNGNDQMLATNARGPRSNDEILESLSRSICNNLGRSVNNELIFKNSGQKISGNNGVIKVTDKYFKNFPLAEIEMSDELYAFLRANELINDDPGYSSVWRNEHGWLVDEYGCLLKLNEFDNKYIRVPERYHEAIKVHPWVDGVRKGEVFLDICDIGNGDDRFKVVNKNKELIGPDMTTSGCCVGMTTHYYNAPDGIRIPLLDTSDENLKKFNQSGLSLSGGVASCAVLEFGQQLSNQSTSKQFVAQEQSNRPAKNVESTDQEMVRQNKTGIDLKCVMVPSLIASLVFTELC